MQDHFGAAAFFAHFVEREFAITLGFPAYCLVINQPGAARGQCHLVGDNERGIETNDYYLKLCGSAGGGYILGFTQDLDKAKTALKGYHLEVVYNF